MGILFLYHKHLYEIIQQLWTICGDILRALKQIDNPLDSVNLGLSICDIDKEHFPFKLSKYFMSHKEFVVEIWKLKMYQQVFYKQSDCNCCHCVKWHFYMTTINMP